MTHTAKRSPAGEGLPAGAARLGRAALQNLLLELQGAVVDVEGVRHDDGMRDALPVVLAERAGAAGVLGAVAGGVLGGHTRELPQEAGGVRAEPAEDLGDVCDQVITSKQSGRAHSSRNLGRMSTRRRLQAQAGRLARPS